MLADFEKALIVDKNISVNAAINKLAVESKKFLYKGIILIVDESRLLGILTDGDIRRAYSENKDFTQPISKIMVHDPIVLNKNLKPYEQFLELRKLCRKSKRVSDFWVNYVIFVDENKNFIDVCVSPYSTLTGVTPNVTPNEDSYIEIIYDLTAG